MILTHTAPSEQMAVSCCGTRVFAGKANPHLPPPARRDRVLVHWAPLLLAVGNISRYDKAEVNLSS